MTNQLVIGKNSLDQDYCVAIQQNEPVFFYPSTKKHFGYLLIKLCHHINTTDTAAHLFVYANNSSITQILSNKKPEKSSFYFHFEPEKSDYQHPGSFFKEIKKLGLKKSANIYWLIEDVIQIIRLRKTKGSYEFLKLLGKPSNSQGIISGYMPFKHLIKQMMENVKLDDTLISRHPELFFTPDDLLFFKTTTQMDHIYYDQSIMTSLSSVLQDIDQDA